MKPGDPLELELDFGTEREILTVSDLNREARLLIESGFGLTWVEGEISNLAQPSSGHIYFSLKDSKAQVRCAMFRQANRDLNFRPDNGQHVLLRARVGLYEARGEFQLVVEHMEEAGEGLLRRRFEELKKKLAAEGLFDPERKQALPAVPTRIGVVTSPTGAAIRDVLIALKRRFPATKVLIYPTSVQGEPAAREIVKTLQIADKRRDCDLLILTRGGGSLEDLWSFNEEIVARAISSLATPIIVGVGHEIDFTIADFVADVRAPTPSQAAELAVLDQSELLTRLRGFDEYLGRFAQRRVAEERRRVETLAHRAMRAHPGVALQAKQQKLDELEGRLSTGLKQSFAELRLELGELGNRINLANPRTQLNLTKERLRVSREQLAASVNRLIERLKVRSSLAERSLKALSPLATLERGYAIVARADNGSVITKSASVSKGTAVTVRLAEGKLGATVDSTE